MNAAIHYEVPILRKKIPRPGHHLCWGSQTLWQVKKYGNKLLLYILIVKYMSENASKTRMSKLFYLFIFFLHCAVHLRCDFDLSCVAGLQFGNSIVFVCFGFSMKPSCTPKCNNGEKEEEMKKIRTRPVARGCDAPPQICQKVHFLPQSGLKMGF